MCILHGKTDHLEGMRTCCFAENAQLVIYLMLLRTLNCEWIPFRLPSLANERCYLLSVLRGCMLNECNLYLVVYRVEIPNF